MSITTPKAAESLKASKQHSATKTAANKIKHLIFTGELVADSNHLETELATRLGMSRTPVREATLTLQAHGLLVVQPRKGIKIKSISVQDMSDIYEIITEMECIAVRRTANMGFTKADMKSLFDTIDRMSSALNQEDREAWAIADEEFHFELIKFSGNKHLEALIAKMNDQVRRARIITLNMRPLPTKSNKDHQKLCQAILKGDADKAVDIHRKHRNYAAKLLVGILDHSELKRV